MASKSDQYLEASWNTIFSAKKRQETRNPRKVESAWRDVQVAWGGLRWGKTDVQTPRPLPLEDSGRMASFNTPSRDGWRIEAPQGEYRRP